MRKVITCLNFLTSHNTLSSTPTHRARCNEITGEWTTTTPNCFFEKYFPFIRVSSRHRSCENDRGIMQLWMVISHISITGSSSLYSILMCGSLKKTVASILLPFHSKNAVFPGTEAHPFFNILPPSETFNQDQVLWLRNTIWHYLYVFDYSEVHIQGMLLQHWLYGRG